MREIDVSLVRDSVKKLCIEANIFMTTDIKSALKDASVHELSPLCTSVIDDCINNLEYAAISNIPVCQDTGMTIVFIEIGQDVHLIGGDLEAAINEGVRMGYAEGYLRMSIVSDPLERVNTGDNTPAIIYTKIVSGENINILVSPKGFGSENMSKIKMFNPTASSDEIIAFVTETVSIAGSNPCPPIIVGVGIGGDFEYSAFLAKKALCRDLSIRNSKKMYAEMETKILSEINKLGIGAGGFGGTQTALGVNIEQYPTHIAGLPVAVNIGCHVTRHAKMKI